MTRPMRLFRTILFVCSVIAFSAALAYAQDLPSAPSASVAPAPRQTPPPQQPKPTEQKPTADAPSNQPIVLQSLEDRKKHPTSAAPPAEKQAVPAKPATADKSLAPPPDSETADQPKPSQNTPASTP